jgi:hypothetical protein
LILLPTSCEPASCAMSDPKSAISKQQAYVCVRVRACVCVRARVRDDADRDRLHRHRG